MPRSLLVLALLYTLLNAAKPLHIDDTAYYYYARQLADKPLDPYGFAVYWYQRPEPANQVLAPPVLPYWWSLAIRIFGDDPVLWKLWLLPVALLFVWALASLFRRFAPGLETPLTWLTVLSPAFLPGFNFMLDVPALALSLTAVVLLMRACDRGSAATAVFAGLVAGLAAQTKYTGFLAPATMFLYALVDGGEGASTSGRKRLGLWLAAVIPAGLVFVAWEWLVAQAYGQSHFLLAASANDSPLTSKLQLIGPLFGILGGIGTPVALLGLVALRARRGLLVAAMGLAGGSVLLVAVAAGEIPVFTDPAEGRLSPAMLVFGLLGLLVVLVLGVVVWVCGRRWRREVGFLLLWLGLELAGYFLLTPFPAVRRLMGLVVVATLTAGWLAARTCRAAPRRRWLCGAAVLSGVLGFTWYGVDLLESRAQQQVADYAAAFARERGAGTVWYVGHWGFQFYAERAGMRPVVTWYRADPGPIPLPPPSAFRRDDWLVVPDWRVHTPPLHLDEDQLEPVTDVTITDPIPLRTIWCYYGGGVPLEHRADADRLRATLYRVRRDFVPLARR